MMAARKSKIDNKIKELHLKKEKINTQSRELQLQQEKIDNKNRQLQSQKEKIDREIQEYEKELETFSVGDKWHEHLSSLKPESQKRWGYDPEHSFKCGMCRKEYKEGFKSKKEMETFIRKIKRSDKKEWLQWSLYAKDHDWGSKCFKLSSCDICNEKGVGYPPFNFRTQRERHMKKYHSKEKQETEAELSCPVAL